MEHLPLDARYRETFGRHFTISNVLARRRGISKANAVVLGAYFGVSAALFFSA